MSARATAFRQALALEGPGAVAFPPRYVVLGIRRGVGVYTEWLGTVMGSYETPYEDTPSRRWTTCGRALSAKRGDLVQS